MPQPAKEVTSGLIQMRCSNNAEVNLQSAIAKIQRAARDGAQIICLPEIFLTTYFCQSENVNNFDLSEPIPGPTTNLLAKLAAETQTVIIVPLFERRAAGVYHNSAAVLDADGSLLGVYRKMHIPDDPLYYEKYYFTPGDLGFRTFDTKYGRIGVLICWDQWFPEAARLTALQGANILFYPTAIGWHPIEKEEFGKQQHDAWEMIQRSHALANGVYVAAVNRVGHEGAADGGLDFWGSSFVADPFGAVLQRASQTDDDLLFVKCDLNHLENVRRQWPFLRDRRIDAYGNLNRRLLD